MAKEQARVGLKADRKRPPRRAKTAADAEPPLPSLTGANKRKFKIGSPSVDVVLTGTDLDYPGLEAAVLVKKDEAYVEPDKAGWVVFITPDGDGILFDEFPISVKVVQAPPDTYYFAVGVYIVVPGPPPVRQFVTKAVLRTHSIEFFVTSPTG